MTALFVIGFVVQVLRIGVPYVCAAMGGVGSERSGVVDIALEGKLLAGAFGAAVAAVLTGSALAGVVCGVLSAMAIGGLHALVAVRWRADSVVTGVALNLLVIGLTRLLLRTLFDSSSNSPKLPPLVPWLGEEGTAASGHSVAGVASDPLFWAAILLVAGTHLWMSRTRFGLRVRAVGEHPEAAETLGVRPVRVRTMALLLSSAVTGVGGVWLAFDQRQFTHEMSAGRGFIALAAVIVGGWRPIPAALACLAFALLEAVQILLQGVADLPSQLLQVLPFAITIVAVAGVVGRSRVPSALGKPYPD